MCGKSLARIFHELLSRDHEDGRATWQPQGVGSEAHLNGTSQGPTPEDARKDVHIRAIGCCKFDQTNVEGINVA